MKKINTEETKKVKAPLRPALDPEARENQLIALAVDVAEEKLRNGTASSQILVHYLKLASSKERLEREKLEKENELLRAKTEALESAKSMESLYKEAIEAFSSYNGSGNMEDADENVY